ncbi:MAG: RNA polymerase sigma factor [Acidimicrobiia bacterium]
MTYLLTHRRIWWHLRATGRPVGAVTPSVGNMTALMARAEDMPVGAISWAEADLLVTDLYQLEASNLVRLARFFFDDRDAAEDLVQEAFIRLARAAGRIKDRDRAPAYLRSIVLNLARDHNRRGLVSLRHRPASEQQGPSLEEVVAVRADQRRVIEALRDLPHRQRDCLVLRYYLELGVSDIASTLGISPNSVKTHLQRGLRALAVELGEPI